MGRSNNKKKSNETVRRRLIILSIIDSSRWRTTKEIQSRLQIEYKINIGLKAVQDDVKALEHDFPNRIIKDDRAKPYQYKQNPSARKYSSMSPAEAVCLKLAQDYLDPILPKGTLDPIQPYIKEANIVLSESSNTRIKNWNKKVMTIHEGLQLQSASVKKGITQSIHEALINGVTIAVKYQSKNKAFPGDYLLHPGGLVYRGRVSYLICAFDSDLNKIIYLPLHRFKKVVCLETFSVHRFKNVSEMAKNLLGFKLNDKKINIKLKFSRFAGSHLFETPLSDEQKISTSKDGFIIVKDKVVDDMELRFWIRAFGDSVEVLQPKALREEFKTIAKRMVKNYQ